jgi:ribonuclease G
MERSIIATCEEGEIKVAVIENSEVAELFIERDSEDNILGNIYIAKVENILPNLEAIFVDIGLEKSAYLPFKEIINYDIDKMKKGDKILVQVTKGAISTKGVRITTNVSFPGRYVVYQPFDKGIGVSKNINSEAERDRLKKGLSKVIGDLKGGFIVRTEGEGIDEKFFSTEVKYLKRTWDKILTGFEKFHKPRLLHQDFGILFKMVREKLNDEIDFFAIDSYEDFRKTMNFVQVISPEYKDKVVFYNENKSLFEKYGIDSICENILKQKIYLKSGGYLIIQEAESLCAIDVNSGGTKGENLEAVVLKTNLEAVKEVALQLRLRNIGGIIAIDFIDMYKSSHKEEVINALKEAVQVDKARIKILPITQMGLVEMTRQRKTESILSFLSEECPYCKGTGRVYSKESMVLKIKRDLKGFYDILMDKKTKILILIYLNPDFKSFMNASKIKFLQKGIEQEIKFVYDYKITVNQYEIKMEEV